MQSWEISTIIQCVCQFGLFSPCGSEHLTEVSQCCPTARVGGHEAVQRDVSATEHTKGSVLHEVTQTSCLSPFCGRITPKPPQHLQSRGRGALIAIEKAKMS